MKKFIKIGLIPLLTLCLIHPVSAEITGSYECTGYDPFLKEKYDSKLTIAKTGETYRMEWKEVNNSYSGIAILENDALASVFSSHGVSKKYGVILYTEIGKNTLQGKWSYLFQEVVGTEDCHRVSNEQPEAPKGVPDNKSSGTK